MLELFQLVIENCEKRITTFIKANGGKRPNDAANCLDKF